MRFITTLVVKPQFQSEDDPDVRKKTEQDGVASHLYLLIRLSNVCSGHSPKIIEGKPEFLALATERGLQGDR